MKPNDDNGRLPLERRPFRVLLIAASQRRQYNCPGVDSKARALMLQMAERMPEDWEVDVEDLGNVYGRARIQSCNACVSTSMALCVWPCNCYRKHDRAEPDLMWDLDLYARLDLADAWAFIAPVNWYGPPSNLKLMFDRLVCMSGGNPDETSIAHKDPERAMALERSPEWHALSKNHLEGRTAAFFAYGDAGANELDASGRPAKLAHRDWFDPDAEPFEDERAAFAPLVWQCRYSGIEVPDALFRYAEFGSGKPYADNQAERLQDEAELGRVFGDWVQAFVRHVAAKGKVPPGEHRAYGHEAPPFRWDELKLAVRDVRLRLGVAPAGSSPRVQQERGINQDATLRPKASEAKRSS